MSTPTFDSANLTSRGERQILGSPRNRTYMSTLPGVSGVYVQENPVGPRMIQITGQVNLTANVASRVLAFAAMEAALVVMHAKIGKTADLVGTDGVTYSDCVLASYDVGPVTTYPAGYDFGAIANATARLIHTVPSVTA